MTSSLSFWAQLRELALPVSLFWLAQIFSFACFSAAVLVSDGPDLKTLLLLGFLALIAVVGCGLGQAAALARLRTWTALLIGGGIFTIGIALDVGLFSLGLGEAGVFVMMVLLLGPPAVWAGMWSVETNRALWATWLPLIWMTGAIFVWSEEAGTDNSWLSVDKLAIWDFVSVPVLGGTVLLLLLYLVSRETHRLALWKRGRDAPLPPAKPERTASRPRLTLLSLLVLLAAGVVLTGTTALIAPYLWRTGEGDKPDGNAPPTSDSSLEPAPPTDFAGMERLQEMLQQMQKSAEQAAKATFISLMVLILLALMLLIGWRPTKRLLLLRHLRDPLWTVSPTTRIEQGWRMVEVALGDVGVLPLPGEDASGLARRATPVLQSYSRVEVHGLAEAAAAADRVRFGLGVTPADVDTMERFSAWTLDTVWERLSEREQLSAMYRGLR